MAEELRLLFKVDKDGMVSVNQLEASMKRVNSQAKTGVWGGFGAAVKQAAGSAKAGLASALGPAVALTTAFMAARKAIQMLQGGARDLNLSAAFSSLVGGAAEATVAMERLQAASNFKVTETDLTMMANKWIMAGKDLNELVRVMPMAEKLAAATNEEVTSVAQKLVEGLKLGKERLLEQYVGVIDTKAAYDSFARSIGKATTELTEHEQVLARAEQAAKQLQNTTSGIVLSPTATQAQQALREWDDLWINISILGARAGVAIGRQVKLAVSGPGVLMDELERGRALVKQRQEVARLLIEERNNRRLMHSMQETLNVLTAPWVHMYQDAAQAAQEIYQANVDALAVRAKESKQLQDNYQAMAKFHQLSGERIELLRGGTENLNILERAKLALLDDQLRVLQEQGLVTQDIAGQLWAMAAAEAALEAGIGYTEKLGKWLRELKEARPEVKPKAAPRATGAGRGPAPAKIQGLADVFDVAGIQAETARTLSELAGGRAAVEAEVASQLQAADDLFNEQAQKLDETLHALREAGKVVSPEAEGEILSALEAQRDATRRAAEAKLPAYDKEVAKQQADKQAAVAGLADQYAVLSGQMSEYQAVWNAIDRMPVEDEADRAAQAIARQTQAWVEQADAIERNREALQRLAEIQGASIAGIGEGIEAAIGWAQSADADLIPERMARATAALGDLTKAMGQVAAAQNDSEMAAGFQGMIQGFGSFAVALGAEVGPVAAIMAALSLANAGFAAAAYNYPQAFAYGASALAYGVVAGMAFGASGTSTSGSKAVTRSLGTAAPTGAGAGGTATYNIYLTGREIIKGTAEGLGIGIIEAVNASKFSGAKFAPQVF